jgi:DNA-binding NtrC family response regulator
MTVALFASEQVPLATITAALQREGVSVSPFILKPEQSTSQIEAIRKGVLISPERGVVNVGEQTERVREIIGKEAKMILCASQPNASDRFTLMECGASEIIEPQSWSAEHIATRVLSDLILDGETQPDRLGALCGATLKMRELYDHIQKLAPLFETVLIFGETGTGKELVAREIHNLSKFNGTYIPINCPEISPELLSSELFGHKKGAFTGADKDRVGLIAAAGKGTVFLDEIGDLDAQAQAKLLRVMEDHRVRRVGSNQFEDVQARIVLATNRDLENSCAEGRFRRDLLERIRGFTVEVPPLRERKADIPLLVRHFIEKYNEEYGSNLNLPSEGIDCLFRYDWPGNVRELRAVVRKAAAYADSEGYLSAGILQESVRGHEIRGLRNAVIFDPAVDTWRDLLSRAQSVYFRSLLAQTNGNKEAAAKLSGLSRSQFFEKIRELRSSGTE